ncbi:MAG: Lrp/AsnC family transcriptional regulator [Clostridia bacterium]|nr:Lrp/AsnC family transcriptional regulator [Clostridia bacterium]
MKRLLELLEEDSTLTVHELAVMLNTTDDEVAAKIKQLEADGVINGYHALINWEKSDENYTAALIELRVTPQKNVGFDDIAHRISQFPEVESVYLVSGGYDLMVCVSASSMQEVALFVQRRLSTIDGIFSTATHFVLTRYKEHNVLYSGPEMEKDERGSQL